MDSNEGCEALGHVLVALLSMDKVLRAQAEDQLNTWRSASGFPVVLSRIATDSSVADHFRQLAAVLLKQYVQRHWNAVDENGEPAESVASEEDKRCVRAILPGGLVDPSTKIRTAVAICIALIARSDWPDQWPDVLEYLIMLSQSPEAHCLHGALRCLALITEDMTDQQVPQIIPVLLPEMLRVFRLPMSISTRVRMRAVTVFYNCVKLLGMINRLYAKESRAILVPMLGAWIGEFATVLQQQDTVDQDCGMKMEVLKALIQLVASFGSVTRTHMNVVLGPIWSSLVNNQSIYEVTIVNGTSDLHLADDSDGDRLGFDVMVAQQFEFIHTLAESDSFGAKIIKRNIGDLAYLVIGYMQMTEDQIDAWSNDPNEFVADEDDESFSYSVRLSARRLIEELVERFRAYALPAVLQAVIRRLQEANQRQIEGDANWWKIREAAMLAIGEIHEDLLRASNSALFDPASFVSQLVGDLSVENPYLRGRALWCASLFSDRVSSEQAQPFVHAAVKGLGADQPAPIRVCSCKAIREFCPAMDKELMTPLVPHILTAICALVEHTTEETLDLCMSTLLVTLKVNNEATASFEPIITPLALGVWYRYASDPLITSDVLEIIDVLARIPVCVPGVIERILPGILSIITDPTSHPPGLTESSVELLTTLLKASSSGIPPVLLDQAFLPLTNLILTTDDHETLQNGTECLTAFVHAGPKQLAAWSGECVGGLQRVLAVISRLLDPALPDQAAIFVGGLLSMVTMKLSEELGNVLVQILQAAVVRLQTAKLSSLKESLLLVFARLVNSHAQMVVDFLAGMTLEGGLNALEFVVRTWLRECPEFHGAHEIKVSSIALAKLLEMRDNRLMQLSVDGEQVDTGLRKTRSMTKKAPEEWTQIPFPVKVFKVLTQVMWEEGEQRGSGLEAAVIVGGDDDEWEDDDQEDNEEEEEEEEEDEGDRAVFADADDFAALLQQCEDEEGDNPLVLEDPLHSVDLKAFLGNCFRNLVAQDQEGFQYLFQHLPKRYQDLVRQAIHTV